MNTTFRDAALTSIEQEFRSVLAPASIGLDEVGLAYCFLRDAEDEDPRHDRAEVPVCFAVEDELIEDIDDRVLMARVLRRLELEGAFAADDGDIGIDVELEVGEDDPPPAELVSMSRAMLKLKVKRNRVDSERSSFKETTRAPKQFMRHKRTRQLGTIRTMLDIAA